MYHYHFHRIFVLSLFHRDFLQLELKLDSSSFPINILQNIGAFPVLKMLSFSDCDLNNTLPTKGKLTISPTHYYINN
jgi:hypothetical protein